MKNIFFILLTALLAACVAQPAAPTVTITPPPAMTITPSAIPIASVTPIPTEAPLPEGIKVLQEKLADTGYSVGWSKENKHQTAIFFTDKDGKKVEVPEIVINADGSGWKRTYLFDNPSGTPEEFTVKGTAAEIKVETIDGAKRLDFPGWKIAGGKWVREIRTQAGKEIPLKVYSMDEAIQILKSVKGNREQSGKREQLLRAKYGTKEPDVLEISEGIFVRVETIHPELGKGTYTNDNEVYTPDRDPKNDIPVIFYGYCAISINDDGNFDTGFVYYKDEPGTQHEILVDYPHINTKPKDQHGSSFVIKIDIRSNLST
ncbi:MAG: hypothetical protein IPL71_04375 [Anaerolineales bacterium]|uniref:hypothetical protein n=1 Tax=Candidatus Villigracilis proximus TaxID=3140683 RepID=UPI0031373660|nr:hypothetical protein [Anaerolineales bacterium]